MAIKEIKREWSPCQLGYVKHFLLHDEEDVKDLPRCSVGSTATVSATDNEYVKTVSGWKLKSECDEDGGTGGGGGGPSVQADWNQTDETAADFIRNKPFGGKEIVFFAGTDVTFTDSNAQFDSNGVPDVGTTVTVVFDGTSYECEAVEYYGLAVCGNMMFMGLEDTGEPFAIAFLNDTQASVMVADTTQTHSIKATGAIIKKIDNMYLPKPNVFYVISGEINGYLYSDATCSTKATKQELLAAVTSNTAVFRDTGGLIRQMMFTYGIENYAVVKLIGVSDTFLPEAYYTAEYTPTT